MHVKSAGRHRNLLLERESAEDHLEDVIGWLEIDLQVVHVFRTWGGWS